MSLRRLPLPLCLLVVAPAVSRAQPSAPAPVANPACPTPVATATQSPPRAPAERQADLRTGGPIDAPPNARLRVASFVGPVESVPIVLLENGASLAFERRVTDGEAELIPQRPFRPGARVTVDVAGIRSGEYAIAVKPDTTKPELSDVQLESVDPSYKSGIVCPPSGPAADRVLGSLTIHDASPMWLRGRLLVDGGAVPASDVQRFGFWRLHVSGIVSDRRHFVLWFPAGTMPVGKHVTLRLEAIDIAANVSDPLDVDLSVPTRPVEAVASGGVDAALAPSAPLGPRRRSGCL